MPFVYRPITAFIDMQRFDTVANALLKLGVPQGTIQLLPQQSPSLSLGPVCGHKEQL
jgi:hypothetical protein